jgi:threonine dehydrogenase-like Zn-dependent dehydrogenase
MKGLVFDLSLPKYALAKAAGRFHPEIHHGPLSCVSLRELAAPELPGPGWVRLRPRLAGLCGSDLATLFFKNSPQLEPFSSFPCVLGHEVLAEVMDDGLEGFPRGTRVVVNPLLPCRLRGLAPCGPCTEGRESGCEQTAHGCLSPGLMIGYARGLPGGMGTEMVAHVSQLHAVPDEVPDEAAVLVEPLAVGLHAVLKHLPGGGERVLVVGGGPVAFATLWALRAAGSAAHVTLLTVEAYQQELARALGADEVARPSRDAVAEAEEMARRTGGRVYRPIIGPPVMEGGFHRVFDCVGSAASLTASLRYVRAHGTVILIGAAGELPAVDWTPIWRSNLTVAGSYVYGMDAHRGERRHTFDWVLSLLREERGARAKMLVTHTFQLEAYREAIRANVHRGAYRSVKTVFDFREANT